MEVEEERLEHETFIFPITLLVNHSGMSEKGG